MRLQFLGDVRDAFKWDLLHWICTKSSPRFDKMFYVPMLNPDDPKQNYGNVSNHHFECRKFIRPFLEELKKEPRTLECISNLGLVEPDALPFDVNMLSPKEYLGIDAKRKEYWAKFEPEKLENTLIFFDPDNGFEIKDDKGNKWILHKELEEFVFKLPKTSAIVVYQHRPRMKKMKKVFFDLKDKLNYAHTAVAAYEGNLAFVAIAGNHSVGQRVFSSMKSYADQYPIVKYQDLSELWRTPMEEPVDQHSVSQERAEYNRGSKEHVARVMEWYKENVKVYPTPKKVTLSEFEVDWEELSGSFRIDLDDVQVNDRFDFSLEASGWTTFYIPMFHSPLGAPASYLAILITSETEHAIMKGLRATVPRVEPYGLNQKTGKETTQNTPVSDRIIDLSQFESIKNKVCSADYTISIFTK